MRARWLRAVLPVFVVGLCPIIGCFGPALTLDEEDNGGVGQNGGNAPGEGGSRGGEGIDDEATPDPTPDRPVTPMPDGGMPDDGTPPMLTPNPYQTTSQDDDMEVDPWCDENLPAGRKPEPRRGATLAFMDFWSFPSDSPARLRMILFGGRAERTDDTGQTRAVLLNDTWFYYPRCGRWQLVPGTESGGPIPREGHAMVMANGSVFIIGGRTSTPLERRTLLLDDVWQLDLARYGGGDGESGFSWAEVLPGGEAAPSGRWGHSAVLDTHWEGEGSEANRNRILIYGGNVELGGGGGGSDDRREQTVSEMWSLNLRNILAPQWERMETGGEVPFARRSATSVYVTIPVNGAPYIKRWFLFGGIKGAEEDLNGDGLADGQLRGDAWFFDFNAQIWERVEASGAAPEPRYGAHATWDPNFNRVLIFGGRDAGTRGPLNDVQSLEIDRETYAPTWKPVSNGDRYVEFPNPLLPERRSHAAFALDEWNGRPYLFGGQGPCGALNDTWVFDTNLIPAVWDLRRAADSGITCLRLGDCPTQNVCTVAERP